MNMEYVITAAWKGRTVKDYLYTVVGVSRSVLTRLKKKENGILLNGYHVTVRAVLAEGDVISLSLGDAEDERSEKILPRQLPLHIVYEDADLLVLNKEPDMPTHPTHGHYEDTLANAVAYYMQESGSDFVFRAVNRLDRDTSGLVLVAKSQLSCAKLSRSLQQHSIDKKYFALLCGSLNTDRGEIDSPIRRVSDSIITRECCEKGQGDPALTRYTVLARYDGYTLVCATPVTGRTHQLRVHFASIGHPIVGDDLYGSASPMIGRQALHAAYLSFPHPADGKTVTVFCNPPKDMLNWMKEYDIHEIEGLDQA